MLVANLDKKTAATQVIRDVTHSQNGDQYANVIGRGDWQHSVPRQAHATHAALVSANPLDSSFNPARPLQDDPKWSASASLVYRHPRINHSRLVLT
jgi:hypothetical protein